MNSWITYEFKEWILGVLLFPSLKESFCLLSNELNVVMDFPPEAFVSDLYTLLSFSI